MNTISQKKKMNPIVFIALCILVIVAVIGVFVYDITTSSNTISILLPLSALILISTVFYQLSKRNKPDEQTKAKIDQAQWPVNEDNSKKNPKKEED